MTRGDGPGDRFAGGPRRRGRALIVDKIVESKTATSLDRADHTDFHGFEEVEPLLLGRCRSGAHV